MDQTLAETLDAFLTPRLRVVLSDNIQPRCGCRKPGKWTLHRLLVIVSRGKRMLFEMIEICECPRCWATWPWGQIGARPTRRPRKKGRR